MLGYIASLMSTYETGSKIPPPLLSGGFFADYCKHGSCAKENTVFIGLL